MVGELRGFEAKKEKKYGASSTKWYKRYKMEQKITVVNFCRRIRK